MKNMHWFVWLLLLVGGYWIWKNYGAMMGLSPFAAKDAKLADNVGGYYTESGYVSPDENTGGSSLWSDSEY